MNIVSFRIYVHRLRKLYNLKFKPLIVLKISYVVFDTGLLLSEYPNVFILFVHHSYRFIFIFLFGFGYFYFALLCFIFYYYFLFDEIGSYLQNIRGASHHGHDLLINGYLFTITITVSKCHC